MSGSILPSDEEVTPAADADAAAASALAASSPEAATPTPPEPFGRAPRFDFDRGRMVRSGSSPVWVTGHDALIQWCLMAFYSARYAHAVFTDEFGAEEPELVIGQAADAAEAAGDLGEDLREAWLVHDRLTSVEDFEASFVPLGGGLALVFSVTVVTDEDERIDIGPVSVALSQGA